ncbi:torsin-4A-like [Pristis pectinata]|uniref:torsin-4A-like n=1 Tax=Pristis pectinata TaxID=685728 RepID=UPI00223E5E83|nr:torsin-4A-like [Pristis pectinata]
MEGHLQMKTVRHLPSYRRQSKMEVERRYRLAPTMSKLRLASRLVRCRHLLRVRSGAEPGSLHRLCKKKSFTNKKRAHKQWSERWWVSDTAVMCVLYLLCGIVALQVYDGENVEENLLTYDIDHLEKTLHEELVGQTLAINKLTKLLRSYLATYFHTKPLVLSINGPTGVGKSYMGRMIAKHFRSTLEPWLVLHHSAKHHSQQDLSSRVPATFSRALRARRVPVLLLDQLEHAGPELLDFVEQLMDSNHTSAVYIFLSNIGRELIAQSARHSFVHRETTRLRRLSGELARLMSRRHPLWREVQFIPLLPLDQPHVVQCARQLMERTGFYPQDPRAEAMANSLNYYRARQRLYSEQGCKPVLPMVRQLKRGHRDRKWP